MGLPDGAANVEAANTAAGGDYSVSPPARVITSHPVPDKSLPGLVGAGWLGVVHPDPGSETPPGCMTPGAHVE